MQTSPYSPVLELTRGETVECVHLGAAAIVTSDGDLLAWYGDPQLVVFLRSTAKPFQAMPFLTMGGAAYYGLTPREVALLCASHSGTDEHVAVARSIQAKAGIAESELLCGVHYPLYEPSALELRERKEAPTSNRHNCSGKHSGMLAYVHLKKQRGENWGEDIDYIDPLHPIQAEILQTFAEMCNLPVEKVALGIDGCSAPNFAAPLYNAALAYARLCDPQAGRVQPQERAMACRLIVSSMMANPDMVAGPGRFDTHLMTVCSGKMISKGGAEGYQGIGLLPGALGPGSPALGIALKVADGDARGKVRSAFSIEVLRQLGALNTAELEALAAFGPSTPVLNWRNIIVGRSYPSFELNWDEAVKSTVSGNVIGR
jgi:L-asparaginase II